MTHATINSTTSIESGNQEISALQNLQRNPRGRKTEGERVDVYTMVTDRILELLEQGVIPWKKPWRAGKSYWPMNLISKKEYTGINVFLLAMTPFESPYFLTYKQARALGGNIRTGSKGFPIIYWSTSTKEKQNESTGEAENKSYSFLKYFTVFNLEQTEGIEFPVIEPLDSIIDFNPIEECEKICKGYNDGPDIVFLKQRACYSPSFDLINMPKKETFFSEAEYYGVLFHEMTHSTGHENRLNRDEITGNNSFGDEGYCKEELVAEMGAAFLCAHANIAPATLTNSAAYISGWLQKLKSDKKLVIQAASAAQKAAIFILGPSQNESSEEG